MKKRTRKHIRWLTIPRRIFESSCFWRGGGRWATTCEIFVSDLFGYGF